MILQVVVGVSNSPIEHQSRKQHRPIPKGISALFVYQLGAIIRIVPVCRLVLVAELRQSLEEILLMKPMEEFTARIDSIESLHSKQRIAAIDGN